MVLILGMKWGGGGGSLTEVLLYLTLVVRGKMVLDGINW